MYKLWYLCNSVPSDVYTMLRGMMQDRHKEYDDMLMFSETMRLDGEQSLMKVAGVDDDWKLLMEQTTMYDSNVIAVYDAETHKDVFDFIYTDAWYEEDA